MRIAAPAANLIARYSEAVICPLLDILGRHRGPEAGPTRAGVELRFRTEEGRRAAHAAK